MGDELGLGLLSEPTSKKKRGRSYASRKTLWVNTSTLMAKDAGLPYAYSPQRLELNLELLQTCLLGARHGGSAAPSQPHCRCFSSSSRLNLLAAWKIPSRRRTFIKDRDASFPSGRGGSPLCSRAGEAHLPFWATSSYFRDHRPCRLHELCRHSILTMLTCTRVPRDHQR